MNIYLIGMMGSGKSTVGKILAKKMDLPFMDLPFLDLLLFRLRRVLRFPPPDNDSSLEFASTSTDVTVEVATLVWSTDSSDCITIVFLRAFK